MVRWFSFVFFLKQVLSDFLDVFCFQHIFGLFFMLLLASSNQRPRGLDFCGCADMYDIHTHDALSINDTRS